MRRLPAAILPAAACLWILVLVIAPLALARGAFPIGTVATYQSASILCHQKTERSFTVAKMQMPVCARCFGLYLAGGAGTLAAFVFSRRRPAPNVHVVRMVLAAAALPMLLSIGLEWLGVIQGSNVSRFASALALGFSAGWLLQHMVIDPVTGVERPDALSFRRT
jgi:uncharacterized membrane protein